MSAVLLDSNVLLRFLTGDIPEKADRAKALLERGELVGLCAGLEVDMVRDRDLGDAALDRLAREFVDRDIAVRG